VVLGWGAVAFVGQSGVGKSTLAASFACCGYPVLTDDYLELRPGISGWLGLPAYGSIRLWSDAVASLPLDTSHADPTHMLGKWRITAVPGILFARGEAATLRHLYLLAPTDPDSALPATITPLTSPKAMIELARHSFRLEMADPARIAAEFADLGAIARQVPASVLQYARQFSALPAIHIAVMEHLSQTSPSPS
jgi:hypothetical protein